MTTDTLTSIAESLASIADSLAVLAVAAAADAGSSGAETDYPPTYLDGSRANPGR